MFLTKKVVSAAAGFGAAAQQLGVFSGNVSGALAAWPSDFSVDTIMKFYAPLAAGALALAGPGIIPQQKLIIAGLLGVKAYKSLLVDSRTAFTLDNFFAGYLPLAAAIYLIIPGKTLPLP